MTWDNWIESITNDGVYLAMRQAPDGETPTALLSRAQLRMIIGSSVQRMADAGRKACENERSSAVSDYKEKKAREEGKFLRRNRRRLVALLLFALGIGFVGEAIDIPGEISFGALLIGLSYIIISDRKPVRI
jgi:hypothetical protein